MITEQLELFPLATVEEIKQAKLNLARYRRKKAICLEFEGIGVDRLATKQISAYNTYIRETDNIERAIRLIDEDDIRKALILRYIEGVRRKLVIAHFGPIEPSTIDRRINRGIVSVANSLKLFE